MLFLFLIIYIFLEFLVVHNGIVTNYRDIKEYLIRKGHKFESETDTEVIAKLIQHIYDRFPNFNFRQLVEATIQQLVRFTNSPLFTFTMFRKVHSHWRLKAAIFPVKWLHHVVAVHYSSASRVRRVSPPIIFPSTIARV